MDGTIRSCVVDERFVSSRGSREDGVFVSSEVSAADGIGAFLSQFDVPPDWDTFAAKIGDLLSWQDNVLKKYYRPETLTSELAKKTFLFPDRL